MSKNYETTIIIPDSHADPRFPNHRYVAAGRFIAERRPDNIVQLGDFGNLESLCFHNKGRPLLQEGMRLKDDMDAMQEAYELLQNEIDTVNRKATSLHRRRYSPRMVWLDGNHEYRVRRYLEQQPELDGYLPEAGLVNTRGWEYVPYMDNAFISGVRFTHIPINPGNSRPYGGKYVTWRVVENSSMSVVFGHTHSRTLSSLRRVAEHGAEVINSYAAGCYIDYHPDYVRGVESIVNWWRGLSVLTHFDKGEFDVETVSMERLFEEYL